MTKNLELKDFMNGKVDAASIKNKYLKDVTKKSKNTRITFLTPNVVGSKSQARRVQPPLGIACLAGVLDEYGFNKLQIIDSSLKSIRASLSIQWKETKYRIRGINKAARRLLRRMSL